MNRITDFSIQISQIRMNFTRNELKTISFSWIQLKIKALYLVILVFNSKLREIAARN